MHGSASLGYADADSDIDFAAVWEEKYTEKSIRQSLLEKLGAKIEHLKDQDHKGSEHFSFKEQDYNVSHKPGAIFLNYYRDAITGEINDFNLYGLGGFARGKIIYDPNSKLKAYKDTLIVTPQILQKFKELRENSIVRYTEKLDKAAKRKQIVPYLAALNYLLTTHGMLLYLSNGQFPMVPKWIEKDIEKFGWENSYLNVLNNLKEILSFEARF